MMYLTGMDGGPPRLDYDGCGGAEAGFKEKEGGMKEKNKPLPPRPWEGAKSEEEKPVPVVIYINGQPVKLARLEALGVIMQITQILTFIDGAPSAEGGN